MLILSDNSVASDWVDCLHESDHRAEVDAQGVIRPKQPVALPPGSRVLVTVPEPEEVEAALLSEAALGADWNRPKEEAAWSDLGQG